MFSFIIKLYRFDLTPADQFSVTYKDGKLVTGKEEHGEDSEDDEGQHSGDGDDQSEEEDDDDGDSDEGISIICVCVSVWIPYDYSAKLQSQFYYC